LGCALFSIYHRSHKKRAKRRGKREQRWSWQQSRVIARRIGITPGEYWDLTPGQYIDYVNDFYELTEAQERTKRYHIGVLMMAQGVKTDEIDRVLPGWRKKERSERFSDRTAAKTNAELTKLFEGTLCREQPSTD
jgi:hypothetical protein